MNFDHWDRRLAAWLKSHMMADGPVHEVAKRIDPETALFVVKCITTFGSDVLGEHALAIKEILEAVHESQALEPVLFQAEVALGLNEAGPAQPEQVEAEQVKTAEQVKAEQIKADAELAAQVIEEQTVIVEKEISDREGKSAGENEIDALKKDFEREQQDLEGKLDEMARNYFDKYPDLSDDQRRDATDTFKGVKDEAMENLHGQQETRLEELTRAQQEQREDPENLKDLEDLEERLKELEGTRDERS
jgi:hypothetical protein